MYRKQPEMQLYTCLHLIDSPAHVHILPQLGTHTGITMILAHLFCSDS